MITFDANFIMTFALNFAHELVLCANRLDKRLKFLLLIGYRLTFFFLFFFKEFKNIGKECLSLAAAQSTGTYSEYEFTLKADFHSMYQCMFPI